MMKKIRTRSVRAEESPAATIEAPAVPQTQGSQNPQNLESSTLQLALKLLSDSSDTNYSEALSRKEMGLSLSLIGAAEIQAARIALINQSLFNVETRILERAQREHLDTDTLLEIYKVITNNLERAGKFISETGKALNWESIKKEMVHLETRIARNATRNIEVETDAIKILEIVANRKRESDIENE